MRFPLKSAVVVWAVVAALIVFIGITGCGRQAKASFSVIKLRGIYRCTTQPHIPALELTNSFVVQFGNGVYVSRFFGPQSNLIAQSSCDGDDIAHWWHTSYTNNAQDTAWIWSANNTIFESPPLSTAELMVLSSLAAVCTNVHDAFFQHMKSAFASYYDSIPIIGTTNYPNGIQVTELFDAGGRCIMRLYATHTIVPDYATITNPICRILYSNYVTIGKAAFPRSLEIQDLRSIGLDCRYHVETDVPESVAITKPELYPDVSTTNTFALDRRFGFHEYSLRKGIWPTRQIMQGKPTVLRSRLTLGVLIALSTVSASLLIIFALKQKNNKNTNNKTV
jgi:hypothetical protein